MTYHHLTIDELTMIANFRDQGVKAYRAAKLLHRGLETVYRVYRFLAAGHTLQEYYQHYRENKAHCGRKAIQLPTDEVTYIKAKVAQGWTPDTIMGRAERPLSCSMRTLYRLFERGNFDVRTLPMKGKRRPNGYVERRGKAGQLGQSIHQRAIDFPNFNREFGHLEADTVQGKGHQGAVMTLVERTSKVEVILNVHSKTATSVIQHLQEWLAKFPPHFFKSITFDNGKEFADWRAIANQFDLQTYFAEVGAPNQRGLNENNNGLLRRDGLHKGRDLRHLADEEVAQIMSYRNNIPRKSLGYQTPYEVFMKYVTDEQLLFF